MRRLAVVLWMLVGAGCIESNPQPSPLKQDTLNGGGDTALADPDATGESDGSLKDLVSPEDAVADSAVDADLAADVAEVNDGAGETTSDVGDVEVVEMPAGCCVTDSDCVGMQTCVQLGGVEVWGKCLPEPGLGECWVQEDCDLSQGNYCSGASVQSCQSVLAVMDTLGHCVHDDPPFCCGDDSQCLPGYVCVGGAGEGGTCEPAPQPGTCWDDDDCYETQTCEGEMTCGCMGACAWLPTPGTCSPLPQGCCFTDEQCGVGFVCRARPTESGQLPGACVPNPLGPACMGDSACCWEDSDCPGESTCGGASLCGCIELCWVCGACLPDTMGFCK